MKYLLIGHSVEDHIHISEKETVSPGGIFYSALGLSNFVEPDDEIFLLTAIDKKTENLFSSLYKELNQVYFQYVENIPKVHLRILETTERCEYYENILQNLDVRNINSLNEFNGILMNMITGFDVTLQDLNFIRKNYTGLIYLDIHTLSRGLDEKNQRYFRPIPNMEGWISAADIIQVNEHEIFTLSNKKTEFEAARDILKIGLKYLIVTKGGLGARIFWIEDNELRSHFISAIKINSINKVGCGDVFGSLFFNYFIKHQDFQKALTLANTAAGFATSYSNINEFKKLKDDTFARFN
ncbi:MAG: carbohydrate kinase family protein [Ignavibacteriales bacterium]|nr:carbohydrate kinase family protein [Ignavibacteriales bacterium]